MDAKPRFQQLQTPIIENLFPSIMSERLPTVLIVFVLVLNSTQYSNILILVALVLLCLANRSNIYFKAPIKICFLLSVFLSVSFNFPAEFNLEDLIRLMTLSALVLFYPFRINFTSVDAWCLYLVFCFLFLTHILSVLDFGASNEVMRRWYPIKDNIWRAEALPSIADVVSMNRRFGGVFYNPNIMGQSILFLYLFISVYLIGKGNFKVFVAILIACLFSIVLTGSRSALAVFVLISAFNLINFNVQGFKIVTLLLMSIPFLFFTNLNIAIVKFYQSNRIFSIFNGAADASLEVKFANLTRYLNDFTGSHKYHLSQLLFGNFDLGDYFFDADYGYVLYSLGVVGLVLLFIFFVLAYSNTMVRFRYFYFVFLILFAATIIVNFRFSILLFLLLSLISKNNYVFCQLSHENSLDWSAGKSVVLKQI